MRLTLVCLQKFPRFSPRSDRSIFSFSSALFSRMLLFFRVHLAAVSYDKRFVKVRCCCCSCFCSRCVAACVPGEKFLSPLDCALSPSQLPVSSVHRTHTHTHTQSERERERERERVRYGRVAVDQQLPHGSPVATGGTIGEGIEWTRKALLHSIGRAKDRKGA